jgi:hypothetical protein
MDSQGDLLTTHRIETDWGFTFEPYPSRRFGFIDSPANQFGNVLILARTRIWCDGPEPLLILDLYNNFNSCANWKFCNFNLTVSWIHLHHCRFYQYYIFTYLQIMRIMFILSKRPGCVSNYRYVLVRLTGVYCRYPRGIVTIAYFANVVYLYSVLLQFISVQCNHSI